VKSLVAYLRKLADVPGADEEQRTVQVPRVRIGEHIAKSTCHICHSAAGPNPTPQQLAEGDIPPLSTLAQRTNQAEFIRKVTCGAPILMGMLPELLRGRMPVFYYLSREEAADVYLYLTRHPPYPYAVLDAKTADAPPRPDVRRNELELVRQVPVASSLPDPLPARKEVAAARTQKAAFSLFAALLVTLFLGLGSGFTVRELRRLSANCKNPAQEGNRVECLQEGAGHQLYK